MRSELSPATTVLPHSRVPYWDNARVACIILVVLGHSIQRLIHESDAALTTYLVVYAFHMPAFAIVSGYFARSGAPTTRQMTRVLTDIVLPYIIMESIWSLVQFMAEDKTHINPTRPSWTLWFLLALGVFRLVMPYLVLLRWPLAWAVVISVGVGYFGNVDNTFALSRALGILPFFVFGWQLRRWGLAERWLALRRGSTAVRGAAITLLLGWIVVVLTFLDTWRSVELRFWFFYDDSYVGLGSQEWWAGGIRLGVIALAAVLSVAFLVLVPRTPNRMTRYGQFTMYVYLLHSFVLYPLRESGVMRHTGFPDLWLTGMLLLSIILTVVLSSAPVRRLCRPFVEPKPRWLFAPEPPDTSRSSPR
ncbi:acyltransferase family protein [Klugiella xanthotipulae]|uniref:Fucose 4-O-acetylase-like acetyltransferase n=1 Tax=Klugiella xanthotipulae TaxID=244735 RepID=A0A543I431_9MICO|nr:acyltransferase family protein [Klugiella xanthotipulae]TQM65353.1 fucose 4-O-acetylase-like acetyltransferase [Klugiella xanthotipulae]